MAQPVNFATKNITVTTSVSVAAAVSGKRHRVCHIFYRVKAAGYVQWLSGSTSLSKVTHAANDLRDSNITPTAGFFETDVGATLFVKVTGHAAATTFDVEVGYVSYFDSVITKHGHG